MNIPLDLYMPGQNDTATSPDNSTTNNQSFCQYLLSNYNMQIWEHTLILLHTVFYAGTIANFLVIFRVTTDRNLHNPTVTAIAGQALADLSNLTTTPSFILYSYVKKTGASVTSGNPDVDDVNTILTPLTSSDIPVEASSSHVSFC